jgi:hypothetical protein
LTVRSLELWVLNKISLFVNQRIIIERTNAFNSAASSDAIHTAEAPLSVGIRVRENMP